jgi:Pyruvate/2-oxoacid:ferredoxin oxidoreductase delta subunit/flavodoxin
MIFYFSGTGNSKWIAQKLAEITEDTAVDIISLQGLPDLTNAERVGLVFPIYAWGAPEPMLNFAKTLPKTSAFTYGVCTCGANAGYAMKNLSKVFTLQSAYSIVMPNNYVVGSNLDRDEEVKATFENAEKELSRIGKEVLEGKNVYNVEEGPLASLLSSLGCKGFNAFARTTKPFYADEKCNGCGLCARECPAKTISMVNGKPSWGAKCYQCMRCINSCPQSAIQYGKGTKKRGRYRIEQYSKI